MSEQVMMPQGGNGSGKRSCCLWGCIGIAVIGIVVLAVAGGAGYLLWGKLGELVVQLTDEAPVALPVTELSPEDEQALETKMTDLNAALEGTSEQKTFELSADELNGLLDSREDLPFGDWVHLDIQDGVVSGQVSLPIDETPIASLAPGRYLNGTGTFEVSVSGGALRVFLVDGEVKGNPIPDQAMQQMRGRNLAQDVQDPQLKELLSKVEELRVEGDHIVVVLR